MDGIAKFHDRRVEQIELRADMIFYAFKKQDDHQDKEPTFVSTMLDLSRPFSSPLPLGKILDNIFRTQIQELRYC